jgi:hypothetical protein
MRLSPLAGLGILLTSLLAVDGDAQGLANVVGYVTARDDGRPLPFADVWVEGQEVAGFANAAGRFEIHGLTVGTTRIRVRRIGFSPATITVGLSAGRTDTVRVRLAPVALKLASVRIQDDVCPARDRATVDTAVLAILQQAQINAERNRLLVREYPFDMAIERTMADEESQSAIFGSSTRLRVSSIDTLVRSGDHPWRYAPGNIIVPADDDAPAGVREKLIVPQLVDFADDAFLAAHCFRYGGIERADKRELFRVEFHPTKAVKTPDVHGSLFFDARSYDIVRSTLHTERPSTRVPAEETWVVRVDTWFKQLYPGLPVIDSIVRRTTTRANVPSRRSTPGAAIEIQRVIDLRFRGLKPDDP